MFITRVELRNIKNHAESSYTFQPGVISICGPNGSGKTTILGAIAWTLFDHLDYKREDFVRRGARKGQATVGFVSDLDEREYLVTRDTGGGYFVYDPQTRSRLVEQKTRFCRGCDSALASNREPIWQSSSARPLESRRAPSPTTLLFPRPTEKQPLIRFCESRSTGRRLISCAYHSGSPRAGRSSWSASCHALRASWRSGMSCSASMMRLASG